MWASKRFLSAGRWQCALAKDFGVVIDQCQKSETSHCAYFLAQWIIDTLILQIKWHLDLHNESLKFFEPSFWLVLVMSEFWLQVSRTRPQIPHAHTLTNTTTCTAITLINQFISFLILCFIIRYTTPIGFLFNNTKQNMMRLFFIFTILVSTANYHCTLEGWYVFKSGWWSLKCVL